MDDPTTPEVGLDEYAELEADGTVSEIETPEEEAPTAAETPEQPTSRRSRAVERGQRTPPEKPVNLDDLPQFREYKSAMDRQIAEAKRQAEELRAQMEEREQQALQARYQSLEQAMTDAVDPDEQRRLVRQMADLQAAQSFAAWQKWDAHVKQRATEEGLNSADFDPRQYSGPTGAAQFERDLAAKKATKLQAELDTYKRTADPANIAKLVSEQVAKALHAQGLNAVDTGAPATPVNARNLDDDIDALNSGRMSHEVFKKRWGKPK